MAVVVFGTQNPATEVESQFFQVRVQAGPGPSESVSKPVGAADDKQDWAQTDFLLVTGVAEESPFSFVFFPEPFLLCSLFESGLRLVFEAV